MSDHNENGERVFSKRRGDLDLSQARTMGTLPEKLVEQAARKFATATDSGKVEILRRAAEALERLAVSVESMHDMLAASRAASEPAKPASASKRSKEEA